ncbi:LysR family transcriptional regulator [Burkholderia multivorans]|uniref:LysR family transcriptional regulator n=1 Tax=Burkholderia multivorans TaxID=87883 RepID=UPI000CFFE380|nr:LysR family transcriptional regulator [Burkholderia multivorans]AYY55323.1 LysR family transcriptional regulator [Burkholderia multivorans]AYZ00070.1 LysR family transcriptional regulator [Burkholderia multivorans]MBU9117628.1 LysR family transcriptional regulator [Burkholderia multivorans]MCA8439072.1 LysR family transcriptional regulator [Burkholderia multivorans]MDN8008976.1 LysR family transcriptional regulator [Burkholderia multivorans]
MNITLRQLRAFLGVARYQSFTRAAEQLHVTQAGLSASVRELEVQLDARLFNRTTRTVSLTAAGTSFLPSAQRTVEILEAAALDMGALGAQQETSLRVAVTPLIAASLMPTVLREFAKVAPDVRVSLVDTPPQYVQSLVAAREVDVGFGAFFERATGIKREAIFPMELVAAAKLVGKRPNGSTQAPLRWRDLDNHPLILLPSGNPIRELVDKHLRARTVSAANSLTVGHLETAIAFAENGMGVAVVPSMVLRTCRRYKVQIHPLVDPVVHIDYYAITTTGGRDLSIARRFADVLARCAAPICTTARTVG